MYDWWYEDRGKRQGPVSQVALQDLISEGRLGPDTPVWSRDTRTWQPIRRHKQFSFGRGRHTPPAVTPPEPMQPLAPAAALQPAPQALPRLDDHVHDVHDAELAGPWTRWLARSFDVWWEILLVGFVTGMVLGVAAPSVLEMPGFELVLGVLCVPAAMVFDALLVAWFGNTPGKSLLGLRVGRADGSALTFLQQLRRNLWVWISGFALGLPLIGLLTMARQHRRLKDGQQASYDGDAWRVFAQPVPTGRRVAFWLGVVVLILVQGAFEVGRKLDERQAALPEVSASTWINPVTGMTATLAPGWQHAQQADGGGGEMHRFLHAGGKAMLLMRRERLDGMSLASYARAFDESTGDEWALDEGRMGDFRGALSWSAHGRRQGETTRMRVRLVQVEDTVWEVTAVLSPPLRDAETLAETLSSEVWDTVLPRRGCASCKPKTAPRKAGGALHT